MSVLDFRPMRVMPRPPVLSLGVSSGTAKVVEKRSALDILESMISDLRKWQAVIEAALKHSDNSHTFDDVCARVLSGDLDMYALPNSVMLCEYVELPGFTQYHVYLGGGNLEEILAYHPTMEAHARKRGCKYLSMTGRLGWKKPLLNHGWTHKLSIYKKEILDEPR